MLEERVGVWGRNGGPTHWRPSSLPPSHSSTSLAYPCPFAHMEAKFSSNISDHKLLLACLPSCNDGLDCVQECFKEITHTASQQTIPESSARFAAGYTWSRNLVKVRKADWEVVRHPETIFWKGLRKLFSEKNCFSRSWSPWVCAAHLLIDENLFSNTLQNSYLSWKKFCVPGVCLTQCFCNRKFARLPLWTHFFGCADGNIVYRRISVFKPPPPFPRGVLLTSQGAGFFCSLYLSFLSLIICNTK